MKNLLLTAAILLISLTVFSQGWYASADNKKSNWETASTWTKQNASMANAPSSTDVGGSYVVNVYGYVTRNGNLTFSGGSTLNVYDTLVIKGNFTVASSVVVHPGGVLIVLGDFTGTNSGSNKLTNNGNVVVVGEFANNGGPITTNGKLYTYDTTPTFNWDASIDGIPYTGGNTNTMKGQLKSKAQLNSANAPLGNFVSALLGTLPIKLISFTGSSDHEAVSLNWVTAKEDGFDHFEVERASGDLIFRTIDLVKGFGYNTSDEHAYSLKDVNATIGINYYRLKSVDINGSFEYSSIVSVVVKSSKSISVYPNYSDGDFINVAANFDLSDNTEVAIFNQEGVQLQKTQITDRDARIDFTNHLTAGVYILKYTSSAYAQTVRLMVK